MSDEPQIPTRTLVLGMVRRDGLLVADDLYRLADGVGMTAQQVRLCLRRLVADGSLKQDGGGRGRAALYRAAGPGAAVRILPELDFAVLARAQDAGDAPWDGRWRLVGFNVPEANRAARDRLRDHVTALGGAPVHGGLYVSPNDWDGYLLPRIEGLGIVGNVTLLETEALSVAGLREPRDLAAHLWDLERIARDWKAFSRTLATHVERLGPATTRDALLAAAVAVVVEYARAMQHDPLLPPELLPRPWPGTLAREEMRAAWELLGRVTADFGELSLLTPLAELAAAP